MPLVLLELPALSGFSAWDEIPTGQTVTGSIVYDGHSGGDTSSDNVNVDLPGIAPVALTSETVNVSASSGAVGDPDATCLGSSAEPTAPAGKVCIYIDSSSGIDLGSVSGLVILLPTRSFDLTFDPTGIGDADEFIFATWAYTAP